MPPALGIRTDPNRVLLSFTLTVKTARTLRAFSILRYAKNTEALKPTLA